MCKDFRYGRVIHIQTALYRSKGRQYKMVSRVHERGFSQTEFVWKYSNNKSRFCWCTVYNIESSIEIT